MRAFRAVWVGIVINLLAAAFTLIAVSDPDRVTMWIYAVACNLAACVYLVRSSAPAEVGPSSETEQP